MGFFFQIMSEAQYFYRGFGLLRELEFDEMDDWDFDEQKTIDKYSLQLQNLNSKFEIFADISEDCPFVFFGLRLSGSLQNMKDVVAAFDNSEEIMKKAVQILELPEDTEWRLQVFNWH